MGLPDSLQPTREFPPRCPLEAWRRQAGPTCRSRARSAHSAFHFHAGPALSGSPPFFAARLGHALLWRGWRNLLRWAANGLRAAIRRPEPDAYPPLPYLAPTSHRHQNAAVRRVRRFGPPSSTGRFLSDWAEVWGDGASPGRAGHGRNFSLADRTADGRELLAGAARIAVGRASSSLGPSAPVPQVKCPPPISFALTSPTCSTISFRVQIAYARIGLGSGDAPSRPGGLRRWWRSRVSSQCWAVGCTLRGPD
jgi:hypothetical protein